MKAVFCAMLSLILAALEWLGSPDGGTPPTSTGTEQSSPRDAGTPGAQGTAVPIAPGSEHAAAVFALLRAIDPCGLHDVAAAARITGDSGDEIRPDESLSACQLRLRHRPLEPTWTFTTRVGVAFSAADRWVAIPEEIDGRTVYRTEVERPRRSCAYTRAVGGEWGISLTVFAPVGEPNAAPCPVARAYVLAAQPLTRLVLRLEHRTEPRFPLASLDPCAATNDVLRHVGVSGTAEPTTPDECRIQPDARTVAGDSGSAVTITYGFGADPGELAGASGRHEPVTILGRTGVATPTDPQGCRVVVPYDNRVALQIDRTRWVQTVAVHTSSCDHAKTVADTVLHTITRG